jgi:hypothetical protein
VDDRYGEFMVRASASRGMSKDMMEEDFNAGDGSLTALFTAL